MNYSRQKLPVKKAVYDPFPAGTIHPRGWLENQLKVQMKGLPGRADEFFFKGEYWLGGNGARDASRKPTDLGASHLVVGWLNSLVEMAYLMDDPVLKEKAQRYIEYLLSTRQPDGSFGPDGPKDSLWPDVNTEYASYEGARVQAAGILLKYYGFTGDERALDLVKSFVLDFYGKHHEPGGYMWFNNIGQKGIRGLAYTLYCMTGDEAYMDAIERHLEYVTPESDWKTGLKNFDPKCTHGAVTSAVSSVAEDDLYSGDPECKEIIDRFIQWLDDTQLQVGGHYTSHEFIAVEDGRNPTNGSECCPMVGHADAMVRLFQVYGEGRYADRAEEIFFNGTATFMSGDAWSHQYDQQVNQILCTTAKRRFDNRDDANTFAINPHYPCCNGSIGRPLMSVIRNQWMRTGDHGIVAFSYCPVEFEAAVGEEQIPVKITVESEYPFRGTGITITVHTRTPVRFPLYLRAPGYIGDYGERTAYMIDGKMVKMEACEISPVTREWKDGDVLQVNIPMNPRFIKRSDDSTAVKRGPLYYALRVSEAYRQTKHNYEGSANWEILPASDWNIGLYTTYRGAYASVVEEHHPISDHPYAHQEEVYYNEETRSFQVWREKEPVILHIRGRKILNWGLHRVYAMSDDIPAEKDRIYGEEVSVELIPYGCSSLRIAEFPSIL